MSCPNHNRNAIGAVDAADGRHCADLAALLLEDRRFFRVSIIALGFALLSWPCSAASDLDRAYRIIAGRHVVDLTHSFGPTTPVGSGFGQANFTPAFDPKTRRPYTLKEDGFRTTCYDIVGQYGTHVDPPAHFAEDGVTMDKIPLKQMLLEHCPVRAVIPDRPA